MTSGTSIRARPSLRCPRARAAAIVSGAALAAGALALAGLAQGGGPDGALPASAHDYLVSSTPAAGSVVDAPPAEVSLTFSDVILDLGAAGGSDPGTVAGSAGEGGSSVVQVTGPDGQGTHFETGCATNAGRVVSVPVALGGSGEYTVTWRVVSADGHPVSDSIAFTYQAPADAVAAAGTADGPSCGTGGAAGSGSGSAASDDAGAGAAGSEASSEAGSLASEEQGVAPYLGVIVGVGIGIVVLAAVAVVLIVVTGRRRPASPGSSPGDAAAAGDGPPAA